MECQNCGTEISNDAISCSKCGMRLDVGNTQKDMLPIDGRYGYTQTHERCWGSNSTMTPGQLGSSQGQEHDSSQDTKARVVGLYANDDSDKDTEKKEISISMEKKEQECSSSNLALKIMTVMVWTIGGLDLVFLANVDFGGTKQFILGLATLCIVISFSRREIWSRGAIELISIIYGSFYGGILYGSGGRLLDITLLGIKEQITRDLLLVMLIINIILFLLFLCASWMSKKNDDSIFNKMPMYCCLGIVLIIIDRVLF